MDSDILSLLGQFQRFEVENPLIFSTAQLIRETVS
jgi:hypothetical protein